MARPSCNKDVWDLGYQEWLVDRYGHENQVGGYTGDPADCPQCITNCPKESADEAYGDGSEWDIKK